jgi:hypothetical protein
MIAATERDPHLRPTQSAAMPQNNMPAMMPQICRGGRACLCARAVSGDRNSFRMAQLMHRQERGMFVSSVALCCAPFCTPGMVGGVVCLPSMSPVSDWCNIIVITATTKQRTYLNTMHCLPFPQMSKHFLLNLISSQLDVRTRVSGRSSATNNSAWGRTCMYPAMCLIMSASQSSNVAKHAG